MFPELKINLEDRDRLGFHASDFGKMGFDIYCAFKRIPPTNPVKWYETLKWGAGKGVELQMLRVLKDSGYVPEEYDQDNVPTIEIEREGIKVRMKIDALNMAEQPIEIKSINNKNAQDILRYKLNKPRENYVGQLSTYMDALKKDVGHLFVAAVDGLSHFWFECRKIDEGIYQCGDVVVNVFDEYKRWAKLKTEHIDKGIEPDPFECGRYKIPLNEIDWSKLSTYEISRVRSGKKVIGDPEAWRILYSPWKDLILDRQGVKPGYSDEELAEIIRCTKGYSSKNGKAKGVVGDVPGVGDDE